jgi:NAD(P)-dependent dehydrogenase (short-subunit alcohol dehydrogenase family)
MRNETCCIITGGSRGIGYGIAVELAKNGFDLAINGVRPAKDVEQVITDLKSLVAMLFIARGDVASRHGQGNEMIEQVKAHYGRLHVQVNNAGIAPKERKDIPGSFGRKLRPFDCYQS